MSNDPFATAEVVELRQYTLHPGARSALVRVFGEHLVRGQEDVGIRVGGVYLDEDDSDRFVWFRGFADLARRADDLRAFYFGPVWQRHRDVANGTMIDSDDVLLLAPTDPPRPPIHPAITGPGHAALRAHVGVHPWPSDAAAERWFSTELHAGLENLLGVPVATWRSHPGPNDFPQLPVRDDRVLVWAAGFDDEQQRTEALSRLRASRAWTVDWRWFLDQEPSQQLTLRAVGDPSQTAVASRAATSTHEEI